MLPYTIVNLTVANNATIRKLYRVETESVTLPTNALSASDRTPNSVSWQSAFWPLVACTLAVMLQDTRRVCGGHYRDSYTLRSSPFVCIVDTFFMLITFLALLMVGCSFNVAAMHVWYDRFKPEKSDFENTFDIFDFVFFRNRPKKSTASLSISADDIVDRTPDTRVHVLPPIAEVDEEEYYSPRDTADIALQMLDVPDGLLTTSAEEYDEGPEVDLGELSFTTLTGNGATSESFDDNNGNHDLEMGVEIDGVLSDDPLLSSTQSSDTHLGSGINRAWRLNMAGFMLGVVPQAVKVFGMRGIPLTQTLVAFYLISFLVPELFRAVAGPADAVDLYPMPIVLRTKSLIHFWQLVGLIIASLFGLAFSHNYLLFYLSFNIRDDGIFVWHKWPFILPSSAFLAILFNLCFEAVVYLFLKLIFACLSLIMRLCNSLQDRAHNSQVRLKKLRAALWALVSENSPGSDDKFILLYLACLPASFIAICFACRCMLEEWDCILHSPTGRGNGLPILWSIFVEPVLLLISY
jgi:hypothetical protein